MNENSFAEVDFESAEGVDWAEWDIDVQVTPPLPVTMAPQIKKSAANAPGGYRLWNSVGQSLLVSVPSEANE